MITLGKAFGFSPHLREQQLFSKSCLDVLHSQFFSLRMKNSLKIIAVGNPGSGKSTILNSLAGEVLFKAGVNIGQGLTFQLDEAENKNGHFLDTPG